MRFRSFFTVLAFATLLVPMLAACGGPTKIDVTLTSYAITLSADTAKAGDITFHVTNAATDQKHEFVIFKTDLAPDQLPMKEDELGNMIVDEEGPGVTHVDEIPEFDAGTTQDLTVTLEPGNYVLVCNLDVNTTHYTHGMRVTFTVK